MHKSFNLLVYVYGFIGLLFTLLGFLYYFLFIPNPYLTPFFLSWINEQGWGKFEVESIALYPRGIYLKNVRYAPTPEIPPLKMGAADIEMLWEKFSLWFLLELILWMPIGIVAQNNSSLSQLVKERRNVHNLQSLHHHLKAEKNQARCAIPNNFSF